MADLKKDKESCDLAVEKFEKEVAKLKIKENLAKKLTIDEFKAFDEYNEVMEEEASLYFDEGFDLCKKQLSLHFLDLDIEDMKIDPNLPAGDDDAEVDEDGTVVQNASLNLLEPSRC